MNLQSINASASPEAQMNENCETLDWASVYGKDPRTTENLTWVYYGGRWSTFSITGGIANAITLTDAATNYLVVAKATGVQSKSTANTNWNDTTNYARTYKLTTAGGVVTAVEDHRGGTYGIYALIGGLGDVVGPASATDGLPVLFDGITGKLVKNSTAAGVRTAIGLGTMATQNTSAVPSLTMVGDLLFTDGTYDIGKSGATRPRDGFFSRNVSVGGTLGVTGNVTLVGGTINNTSIGATTRSTAAVSFLGVGGVNDTTRAIYITNTDLTGSANPRGVDLSATWPSSATGNAYSFLSTPSTAAASFTLGSAYGFFAGNIAKGAASSVTNQYGFYCDNLTSGTNNFAYLGDVSAGSNKWNCYMGGTAANYFRGLMLVGTSTDGAGAGTGNYASTFDALNSGTGGGGIFKNGNAGSRNITSWNAATSGDNTLISFGTEGTYTERGFIDYNRAGGVVRYSTTSDATLKTRIGPAPVEKSLDILRRTEMEEFYWSADPTKKSQIGPFAQKLYPIFKGAVSRGGWDRTPGILKYRAWGVDRTAFTNHLVAGWQHHDRDIAAIKAHLGLN